MLVGLELLQHHFGGEDPLSGVKKLGIAAFLGKLDAPDGKKFAKACQYLNAANTEVERSENATAQAVKWFLRFFTHDAAVPSHGFDQVGVSCPQYQWI